jgi:diadenylate cyclase
VFEEINQNLAHLLQRLAVYLRTSPVELILEFAVIWGVVYIVARFLRGTRAAKAIIGLLVLIVSTSLLVLLLGSRDAFDRLNFLYRNLLTVMVFVLVVVFQPELRRALVRLGETRWLAGGGLRQARVIEEVLGSVKYLAKNKVGALIAIERQVGLKGIIEAGTKLDALVSQELLKTIFWPGSDLHDMGVVIQGGRIVAAAVQFPLAEGDQYGTELGSRHRAGIGLSNEADCLIVIVSEETGRISVAERGELHSELTIDSLRSYLVRGLGKAELERENTAEDDDETEPRAAT